MNEFREILLVGEYANDGKLYPAAKIVSKEPIDFNVIWLAGMCVTVYDTFESSLEEDKKPLFYKAFNEVFQNMMETRDKYSFKVAEVPKNEP